MGLRRRLLGVAAGLLLDRALGDPSTPWHPTAWFGTAMGRVEAVCWGDSRARGVGYCAVGVGLGLGAGAVLSRVPGGLAIAVWAAVGGRSLRSTGATIGALLVTGDLAAARAGLPALVGRDPSGLDASGAAAAVVESLAENAVDAVIAPVLWAVLAGAPGVLAHRAVNTMDAMVGHRTPRHERFGWASARLDDAAAWVPARVQAGLVALARPRSAAAMWAAIRRDAPAHPSPNAGVAEAAVAGALGIELGGPIAYGSRVEDRPLLGRGPRPGPGDIERARRLTDRTELVLLAVVLAGAAAAPSGRGGRRLHCRGRP
ncbi:MAG: adenosylcobinamide-phosphate synthase CbiB [Nocardioides sp.]|nr:adenosylcobinamide-phosphate synthase CbiB [Nocardioides sp.]